MLVSFLALYFPDLPGISVVRRLRAFRAVRLLRRVINLKKIAEGIVRSLPCIFSAFILTALIIGIWAIIGVDFLGHMIHEGEEGYYFGNFFRACLSLGQIMAFDT